MSFALIPIAALTAGAIWTAQPGAIAGGPAAGWTGPGWYVVETSGPAAQSVIRAGPSKDRATCAAHRREAFPSAPRGHPELDVLECREILSPAGTSGTRSASDPVVR